MTESRNDASQGLVQSGETPQVISPDEVKDLAVEVNNLIKAGEEGSAWEMLRDLHPADLGAVLGALPRSSMEILLRVVSPESVAWVLRHMNPLQASRFAARVSSHFIGSILNEVHPMEALDVLRRLSPRQAYQIAENLDQAPHAPEIMVYAPDTAGALMISDFPFVAVDGQSADALSSLRALGDISYKYSHVFGINDAGILVGHIDVIDLALVSADTPVQSLVYPVIITVTPTTSLEECARLRIHYNLTELPVVEDGNRLIGVIPGEFLTGIVVEQDTRQMLRVNSVVGESLVGPLTGSVKSRLPWLTVNLGTTFLAAGTVSLFEGVLAQVVILAVFLPVVAGQGGIGGTQALTLIVRGIALGELTGIAPYRLLAREALLGLLHGLWLGVLVAVIAVVWKQNPALGVVLGVAMLGNMIIAGFVGAAVPLLLRRMGVDPAVASAIIVTTFTDVLGFLLFLGIAAGAIGFLR